ncbi:telomere-associated protein RIF1 isoform X2 [Eleutherodactylus coqui]|uniref:telomere-associated protein RIF1 isoform X2 n=1 Tax=Eleutherodactylus coqui TaxID=57060 RepID=UPI0034625874
MAAADDSQLVPLLETLEDSSTSHTEKTDAYLSIANRLSGEDNKEFPVLVGKLFSRLFKSFMTHIADEHSDLSNAALKTLGFCVYNSTIASGISASEVEEMLSTLNSIAVKAVDKDTCTRALWVISKQNFSPEEVGKVVPTILSTLENVLTKDVPSPVIAYEALNVITRLLEQTPAQMTTEAVRWAKLIIPLVVHSAPKVRIRAATALEIGLPLLLQSQQEVAALTEQLLTSKIIAELHKLFTCKNETYVLKLWPLFVKLLGKMLHRSGIFINSLLQLEELGFRSSTPAVKKIAFIAWKSLIDNFAANPAILCSSKRIKLLMQPLSSIHVRTEPLALTKVEVWWHLAIRLGSQLQAHFEQICLPLIQSSLSVEPPSTPQRSGNQSITSSTPLQKGSFPFGSPTTPKMTLNSSLLATVAFPSVHLLGIEMMLHFLLGPEIVHFAAQHKIVLSLEPLQHRLISNSSFFSKHANALLGAVQDGFITIGRDASGVVLCAVWKDMIDFVKAAMETGSKKERQGSEVLTILLQVLKNIITSNTLQVEKCLGLLECTVKGLPQKVLASAAYQGTPALFLIQLHFHPGLLEHAVTEERFFMNYETLVSFVFSGPTSPLAFSESVIQELTQGTKLIESKELLWRLWSILVNPLTERINQTNEVNQGDALEHNFSALHNALLLPINHIFPVADIPQPTMKTLMRTWSELYKAFSRCAELVTTTDENACCEELCSRILTGLGDQTLSLPLLERLVQVITVIVECVNFSPYSTKFQPITKAQTPTDWAKKKKGPLGNLHSVLKLLERLIEGFHTCSDPSLVEANASALTSIGSSIISCLSTCISHISLPSVLRTVFSSLTKPISIFYAKTKSESPKVYSSLSSKLEKLLGDLLSCLGSRYTGSYDNELLEVLSPLLCAIFLHKNKALRNQVTPFWSGSFAKAAVLVYPEELKLVLSKVKLKTPILLPGFACSNSAEESSGTYSDNLDSSELGTKISGIEVKSAGKRELLAKAEEPKSKGTPAKTPQAKLKLDFSSPNTKKKLLDEEQSVDFVFIPPETKERVLTEHQKEVLRTKRVDIPVMYNNLDASQDTTLFTQYTQSQENSQEKPEALDNTKKAAPEAKEEKTEEIGRSEAATKEERTSSEVIDIEMLEDRTDGDAKTTNESSVLNTSHDAQNTSNISNGSASSDMVLGTPPPPVSRRQSFITLEKFNSPGNLSLSPLADKKFVKSKVILVPDSQEAAETTEKDDENREKNEKTSQTPASKPNRHDGSKSAPKRERRVTRSAEHSESKISTSEENCKESVAVGSKMEECDFVPDSDPSQLEEKAEELKGKTVVVSKVDTKENTPPDTTNKVQDRSPQKAPTSQMTLRRSSRRQSEILDAVKNENESDKLTQTKDEPTTVSKKTLPAREAAKRQPREAIVKSPGEENQNLSKKPEDSEVSRLTNSCDEELPDSNSSKGSQEKPKARLGTQTRRSLNSLQAVVPAAESDNSETLEGSAKKRRRGRPRSIERLKGESSQESQIKVEVTLKHPEDSSNVGEVVKSRLDINDKTYTLVSDYSASISKLEPDGNAQPDSESVTTDLNKTYDVSKAATVESLMTDSSTKDFSTVLSDFQSSQSASQSLDCHHKRSKRVRRSKNCDCCCDSVTKSGESERKIQKIDLSSTIQLGDTPLSGPCAISTPLANEAVLSFSEIKSDTEPGQEQPVAPLSDSLNETDDIMQVSDQSETPVAAEISSEINATVLAESPKDATSNAGLVKECVEDYEDKEMEVTEVNQETSSCKTYDIEDIVPTSDIIDEKPESDVEDAQTVMVEEEDCKRNKTEAETVLSNGQDVEIEEVQAAKATEENAEILKTEDKGAVPADEISDSCTIDTNLHEATPLTDPDEHDETISEGDSSSTDQLDVSDVILDEEKADGSLPTATEICETPKPTEKVFEDLGEGCSNTDTPPKVKELASMAIANDSPSGSLWSPSASPSTSILKKGLKRQQEIDSPSPVNKIRRVSFADPIYQEGLADDIDRRSPVIRNGSSPSSRSLKMSTGNQPKINTTPTKGFVSPGARALGFKSSKKSLISEMTKESMPSPKESVYPALMNCATSIDIILPQITSNMWARGLGQLIRAKNIKTIGDLSTLTPSEIKTLPIRSPKISTVKKALRVYHEQQTKSRGYDEFAALDEAEKPLNGVDEKPLPADEEKIDTDLPEASATASTIEASAAPDLLAQITALSLLFTPEELQKYSGRQLLETQETLGTMCNCVIQQLKSRWSSPPHDGSV